MRRTVGVMVSTVALLAACSSASDDDDRADATTTTSATGPSRPEAVAQEPSAGCDGEPLDAGRAVVEVESGGSTRAYVRYVPPGLEPGVPAPVVVDLTAYSPASTQEAFSSFTRPDAEGSTKADEVGAVVLTPEPVNGEGLLTWNIDDTPGWTDDRQLLIDVLDDVASSACVDAERVLVMGFAIGAVMASTFACAHPERVATLATVAGLWDPPGCDPGTAVPVVSFHGDDDDFLPFDGGVGDRVGGLSLSGPTSQGLTAMVTRPGAVAAARSWADRNGCAGEPSSAQPVDGVDQLTWSGCEAPVELHVVLGGSHTWPGSDGMAAYEGLLGPVSQAIDANDVLWDFFTTHA